MLVSGGKILAIDKVNTGDTILGDGVQTPLDVNTDLIATTSSVSSVSSILNQNIDYVSGHLPAVSAGKNAGVVLSATPDGRPLYIVSADDVEQRDIHIIGNNGVSAVFNNITSAWNIGVSADYLSADALNNYYNKTQVDNKLTSTSSWANDTFQKKGNYVSASDFNQFKTDVNTALEKKQDVSAMSVYAQSAWVDTNYQKKGNYVSADDFEEYKTQVSQEFANTSSWANGKFQEKGDYVSATEFDDYKTEVRQEFTNTSSWANETFQEKGEYVSASDFNEYKEQVKDEFESTSAWANETFQEKGEYVSASDFEDYKEKVEQDFENTSAWANETFQPIGEYINASEKFLSANALDDLSGKWESVYNTTVTASGSWNEASAFAANSAKFVTSAGVDFNPDLAYFLKKQEESVVWSGVDLTNLGKMYQISSITPDLISAGISADEQNNPIYVLSAAKPGEVSVPGISGYGLSAWKDTENDEYKVSANIVGNHGVSAAYDAEANTWNVGISANDYSFLFGHYTNNTVLTDGTVLKLDSNNYHGIDIDDDGYITLPETVNKFTFCINEYIDDNTIQAHSYLLNKLVLSAKGNDQIVASQNYYPSEVGASNVTLALTIDATTAPNREYCIVYKGSDVAVNKLHIEASILEEVTSLDSTGGAAQDYTGQNPIRVVDNSKIIQLLYDSNVFSLKRDEQLQADRLTIEGTGGETVDKEAFDKLLHSINGRLTETIPFGALDTMADLASSKQYTYLFRPTIEYELSNKTVARMFGGNGEAAHVSVALYDVNDTDRSDGTLLWHSMETIRGTASELILSADPNTPSGNTISPDHTYRVSVRITNETWHNVLGTHIYGTIDTSIGNPAPWQGEGNKDNHNWPNTFLQSTPGSMDNFGANKPYVSFRTEE